MASLASQQQNLKLALGEAINEFARIAEHSSGRIRQELSGLYGKWVKESFEKALAETKSIDVDKVLALREGRKTTSEVFESPIDRALSSLRDAHGAKYSINELLKNKQDLSADQIRKLGRLSRLSDKAIRRLRIFRSPALSLFTSGWLWISILSIAVLSVPTYRYGETILASMSSQQATTPQEAVEKQLKADVAVIRAQTKLPEKNFVERSSATVKAIWELMDTIPKIINAVAAAWSVLLLWMRR